MDGAGRRGYSPKSFSDETSDLISDVCPNTSSICHGDKSTNAAAVAAAFRAAVARANAPGYPISHVRADSATDAAAISAADAAAVASAFGTAVGRAIARAFPISHVRADAETDAGAVAATVGAPECISDRATDTAAIAAADAATVAAAVDAAVTRAVARADPVSHVRTDGATDTAAVAAAVGAAVTRAAARANPVSYVRTDGAADTAAVAAAVGAPDSTPHRFSNAGSDVLPNVYDIRADAWAFEHELRRIRICGGGCGKPSSCKLALGREHGELWRARLHSC